MFPKNATVFTQQAIRLLKSEWFFKGIILLLVLQAAWIALSGRYPMAFDEDYHVGIIRLYTHHISPFWQSQPTGADSFGPVFRDSSYLYHYLLSFPYRLIAVFTSDQTIQVLWLRAMNIGMFALGVSLYRRVLLKTGASKAATHVVLLVFILIPVVPLLAAQINYDNLFLPLVAAVLLQTIRLSEELQRERRLNGSGLGVLLGLCLTASLVKYAFLPIFLTVMLFMAWRIYQAYKSWNLLGQDMATCVRRLDWVRRGLLIVFIILSASLAIERYGINLFRYHTPVPDCDAVLSVQQCSAYGPWLRDHTLELQKNQEGDGLPDFTKEWFLGMWLRLFFAVDGPTTDFQTRSPLIVPAVSAVIAGIVGLLASVRYGRQVFARYNRSVITLLLAVSLIYVAVLFLNNYEAYRRTGEAVAINGRYLLPIALPLLLFSVLAVGQGLRHHMGLKLAVATLMVLCLGYGGGTLTYILRSSDTWYWPSPAVRTANHLVQQTIGPIVPGYHFPSEFLY